MKPRELTLKAADDIHGIFRVYRCHPPTGWWFRGHANANWDLVPKAGRDGYRLPGNRSLGRFRAWSTKAVAYDRDLPENDWERLAVAQHFGLATCLLDWTENPLVAVFFACSAQPEIDGEVFCFDPEMFVDVKLLDLWNVTCRGVGFIPRAISPRILNQRGVFTVHLPAHEAIEVKESVVLPGTPNLAKITIPAKLKHDLLVLLNDYGINQATLFPDLSGLSEFVNWSTNRISLRRPGDEI